jgi:predicted DNA-binding transcriptional regulator AlpA
VSLLSGEDFAKCLSLTPGAFWGLWREGKIPVAPVRLGNSYLRWRESDVTTWLEQLEPEQLKGTRDGTNQTR